MTEASPFIVWFSIANHGFDLRNCKQKVFDPETAECVSTIEPVDCYRGFNCGMSYLMEKFKNFE